MREWGGDERKFAFCQHHVCIPAPERWVAFLGNQSASNWVTAAYRIQNLHQVARYTMVRIGMLRNFSQNVVNQNQPSCRRMVASLQGNGLQKLSLYLFLSVLVMRMVLCEFRKRFGLSKNADGNAEFMRTLHSAV